jgi:4-amino-4-deoxy-L-arabinose transferase-like glycosyltransferase
MSADRRAAPRALSLALLVGAAALGAALVWISMPGGAGTSPDSWYYLAAARNLLAGEGFAGYTGAPLVFWPPLYPTVLAAIYGVGDLLGANVHILLAVRLLNAVTFAAIVVVAGVLFCRGIRARRLVVMAMLAVVVAYPLAFVSSAVWSEPLLILLCLLFFVALARYLQHGSLRLFAAITLLAALASLQRYVGVFLIPTGCLSILLILQQTGLRQRLSRSVLFGASAAAPLALYLARNYYLSGTLTGVRSAAGRPLHANVSHTYDVLTSWFSPDQFGIGFYKLGLIALAIVTVVLFIGYRRRSIRLRAGADPLVFPLLVWVVIYPAGFIVNTTLRDLTPIDDRYLAPLYIPMIGLVFAALDRLVSWLRARPRGSLPAHALVVLAALWLLYPLGRLRDNIPTLQDISAASQVTYETWRESPLMRAVRADPPAGRLLTNAPLHLLVHTGLANRPVPATLDGWTPLIESAGEEGLLLVWFEPIARCEWARKHCTATDYTVETLAGRWDVTPVIIAADGGVYWLGAGPGGQPGE